MKKYSSLLTLLLIFSVKITAYPRIAALDKDDGHFFQFMQHKETEGSTLLIFEYRLHPGDTIADIAKKTGITLPSLVSLNRLPAELSQLPEQKYILIPTRSGIFLATKPKFDIETLLHDEFETKLGFQRPIVIRASYHSAQEYFYFLSGEGWEQTVGRRWKIHNFRNPVIQGEISSPYGPRQNPISENMTFHIGVDISSRPGENIFASHSGIVKEKGYSQIYGYYIILERKDAVQTLYGHLLDSFHKVNDTVLIGEHIANMGSTGMSTGAHIHFEILIGGKNVDPMKYLHMDTAP